MLIVTNQRSELVIYLPFYAVSRFSRLLTWLFQVLRMIISRKNCVSLNRSVQGRLITFIHIKHELRVVVDDKIGFGYCLLNPRKNSGGGVLVMITIKYETL